MDLTNSHPVDTRVVKEYVLQNGLNKKKKVEMWEFFNASLAKRTRDEQGKMKI